MRGLTGEERELLRSGTPGGPVSYEPASERAREIAAQLIADGRGVFVWERTYDDGVRWVEDQLLKPTALGELALRIDFARGPAL